MRIIAKFKAARLVLIFALTLTLTLCLSGISAYAASGAINGYATSGNSYINRTGASASTTYGSTGSVNISSTYSYVNVNTLATGTSTKSKGYYSYCTVSFSAPSNCRSVKITSSHKVVAYGQTWSTSTSAIY